MAKKIYGDLFTSLSSMLNPRLRRLQLTNNKIKHFYKRIIQIFITHNIKREA